MNTPKQCQNAPFISVVVPMYNVEKYIRTCLDSILAQTFDDFEVICVDDGCSDNTVAIVESYTDRRIRIVAQRNRGLAAARNTGINASSAPFVALLDSDDYWHPEKLEKHFRHLCDNPMVGVSYSSSRFVDEEGNDMGLGQYPQTREIDAKQVLCRNPVGNGSAPVLRRLALEQIAFEQTVDGDIRRAYFDEQLRQSEDIELWTRMALNTQWRFEGLEDALTFYRVNASGLSANLEKQLASWEVAMASNRQRHPAFFASHYSLAKAYQKRYLARRAVQSGNPSAAMRFFTQALAEDARILLEEPGRTLVTGACALLVAISGRAYPALQAGYLNWAAARQA